MLQKGKEAEFSLYVQKVIVKYFFFGALLIVPIHVIIWQNYYNQDLTFTPGRGHLWFLANIFVYTLVLSPILYFLKRNKDSSFIKLLQKIYSNPISLLFVALCFVIETLLIKPEIYTMYAMTLHGFLIGFISFFYGFTFVITGIAFWQTVLKWKWFYLMLAAISYTIRIVVYNLEAPSILQAVESVLWIFSVFGFCYKYLNRPSKTLNYLSQAAYPIYIIHMIFMFMASTIVFPLEIHVTMKLLLVVLITYSGCFLCYEFIIRRISILRPLFGIKSSNITVSKKDSLP
jgi:hypothetical protein